MTLFYDPASNPAGSAINTTSYTTQANYSGFVTGGAKLTPYMLVNTVNDLQNVQNNLAGDYALGADIDASATAGWNSGAGFSPIGTSTSSPFTGALQGKGHVISGLTIDRLQDVVGLFGTVGGAGVIDGVALSAAQISGRFYVGALVGDNYGTVSNARVGGRVSGAGGVGGLIGVSEGGSTIHDVSSSAAVSASQDDVGGLVGVALDSVFNASASGDVSGADTVGGLIGLATGAVSTATASGAVTGADAGGLVGELRGAYYRQQGSITDSYATGSVTGEYAGGLVGFSSGRVSSSYASGFVNPGQSGGGGIAGSYFGTGDSTSFLYTNVYWDASTTKQNVFYGSVGIGAGDNNVTAISGTSSRSPYAQSTYVGFDFSATGPWVIFEGQTRPLLKAEASNTITNAHQLQLVDLNRGGTYTLAANVDLSVTSNPSDVWNPANGFVPIAAGPTNSNPFVGSFNGAGHTISNLTIVANDAGAGLFGVVGASGRIHGVNLANVNITGVDYVGALVGDNYGTVANVSAAGTVTGLGGVGGLIGVSEGGSSVTGISAAGSTPGSTYGVTVTGMGGDDVGGAIGVNLGVVASSFGADYVFGANNVGGLVGFNFGVISGSTASTPVPLFEREITGNAGVGGLVGVNLGGVNRSDAAAVVSGASRTGGLIGVNAGTVETSFASPDPSPGAAGLVGVTVFGISAPYAGGLIGFNTATGAVSDSYATVSSSGAALIGRNYGTVTRAYATGAVGASGAGVTSLNIGTLTDVVWDVATTGTATGVAGAGGTSINVSPIGGPTGQDPTRASSYPGFDFTNVWTIVPGVSLPTLRALPPGQ